MYCAFCSGFSSGNANDEVWIFPHVIFSLIIIQTEMELNELYNVGIVRAKHISSFYPMLWISSQACWMIYYLHEGRKESNETNIKQEYLKNGSNMFSKMYLTQLFLNKHLNSLKTLMVKKFKRKQCICFKRRRMKWHKYFLKSSTTDVSTKAKTLYRYSTEYPSSLLCGSGFAFSLLPLKM